MSIQGIKEEEDNTQDNVQDIRQQKNLVVGQMLCPIGISHMKFHNSIEEINGELVSNFKKYLNIHFDNIIKKSSDRIDLKKLQNMLQNKYRLFEKRKLEPGDIVKRKRFKAYDTRNQLEIEQEITPSYDYSKLDENGESTILDDDPNGILPPRYYFDKNISGKNSELIDSYINILYNQTSDGDTFGLKIPYDIFNSNKDVAIKFRIITKLHKLCNEKEIIITGNRENLLSYLTELAIRNKGYILSLDVNHFGYCYNVYSDCDDDSKCIDRNYELTFNSNLTISYL